MPRQPPINRLILRALLLLTILATAVAGLACGGGDDEGPDPTATAEAAAPTDVEPAAPTTDSVTIGVDFWHAGWKVTLGEATLGPDSAGVRTVSIDASLENLGNQTSTFNSQMVLMSGGNAFGDSGIDQELPNVPAGLSNDGLFAIQVDDAFSLDDATLIVGNPDNNQAVVPIGPASPDDLVSLEPLQVAASGSAAAGPVASPSPARSCARTCRTGRIRLRKATWRSSSRSKSRWERASPLARACCRTQTSPCGCRTAPPWPSAPTAAAA